MALFTYTALLANGTQTKGSVSAINETQAKSILKDRGLLISHIRESRHFFDKTNLDQETLIHFTTQLSQMLKAGIPLFESLHTLSEQYRNAPFYPTLLHICESIKEGSSLADALELFPKSFSSMYCSLVRAGESSGTLAHSLAHISKLLTRQLKIKKQICTAMIYPSILSCFAFLVLFALITFVVPSLEGIIAERPVNSMTAIVITLSHFLTDYWLFILLIICTCVTFIYWKLQTLSGKRWLDKTLLKIPFIYPLVIQSSLARFSTAMASLLAGGVPLLEALRLSRKTLTNTALEKVFHDAEFKILEGSQLSTELKKSPYIPPLVTHMLATGESTSNLSDMLFHIADLYEAEVDKSLNRLSQMAQPIILVVMGVVIGIIMLAVILPLTDVSSLSMGMKS